MKLNILNKRISDKITKDTSVSRAISMAPLARGIFQKYGIKFIGKDVSPLESIEKAALANSLSEKDSDKIIEEINDSLREQKISTENIIKLSDSAAEKLKEFLKTKKDKKGVRLRLVSDGCATYVYDMDFGTKPVGEEIKTESQGISFFIEKKTIALINGTEIDYNQEKGGFVFNNPNVKS